MTDAALQARADEKLGEIGALLDPANFHPLCGTATWPIDDEGLADHLDGARIFLKLDCGPVDIVFGWLPEKFGTDDNGGPHAFSILKTKTEGAERLHALFVPTIDALDILDQMEFSATDTNGMPLNGGD